MADPVPIRAGVRPQTGFGQDLLDYCASSIADYTEEYGVPPTSIAFVLSGSLHEGDGTRATDAYSWDSSETRTQFETCSAAATILTKRAMGIE